MSTAMTATAHASSAAAPFVFSPDQRAMIREMFARGSSDLEFAVLFEVACARRLNPMLRHCYFVKRWDSALGRDTWTVQVSIDGMRALAERTGKYDGQDEPEFAEKDNKLITATVRVYRKDWPRPSVGIAYWVESAQYKKDGSLMPFWARMPHVMLAKVAETIALRKAFPEDMSGLYVSEEMGVPIADEDEEILAVPARAPHTEQAARTNKLAAATPPPERAADNGQLAATIDDDNDLANDDDLAEHAMAFGERMHAAKNISELSVIAVELKNSGLPDELNKPLREQYRRRRKELSVVARS